MNTDDTVAITRREQAVHRAATRERITTALLILATVACAAVAALSGSLNVPLAIVLLLALAADVIAVRSRWFAQAERDSYLRHLRNITGDRS
jgi:heme A synthase